MVPLEKNTNTYKKKMAIKVPTISDFNRHSVTFKSINEK